MLGGGNDVIKDDNAASLIFNSTDANSLELAYAKQPLSAAVSSVEEMLNETGLNIVFADVFEINPKNPSYYSDDNNYKEEITKYTIKQGDTISSIAEYFGISTNTVLWTNNLQSASIIKPGNVLEILPITGIKHIAKEGDIIEILAKKYKASAEEIAFFNGLEKDQTLEKSAVLVIPGGVMPNSMLPKAKKSAPKNIPAYAAANQFSGQFIYPASGHNFGRIHANNGIDISNSNGGPIYAAASGTVILADNSGYNGGYGKHVKIQHSGEVITLYGHMSKVYVKQGQQISQGTIIGMMGNTGRSTGTHLHFEVRGARNPLAKY